MNKTEFLKELENRIRVLEKTEIKDILAEYSQHIDMKMKSGLSEADAIKDFGGIDDLAAEILEAYHVNPEYETESVQGVQETPASTEKKKAVKGFFTSLGSGVKKAIVAVGRGCKWIWKHFIGIFIALGAFIKGFFSKKEKIEKDDEEEQNNLIKEQKTKSKEAKRLNRAKKAKKIKGRCGKMIAWLLFACLAVLVVLCLIPVAIAALASIFGLGVSVVLLVQGYPIIGILIGCLGLAVMSVSLWLLLVSLISRKDRKRDEEEGSLYDEFDDFETENAVNVIEEGDEQ